MKSGAMVIGIIGGLVALIYGLISYSVGGLFDTVGADGGAFYKLLGVGLPICALVGAGMAKSNPSTAAVLMGIPAVGILLVIGFGALSLIPVLLLGVGALLSFMAAQEDAKKSPKL